MSKRLKYISIAIAALIVITLIAPFFIPLESYKGLIISEVKKATGRDLIIDGKISLSILPYPKVTLNKVKLSSIPQAKSPYTLEVEQTSAALALSNLLTGNIVFSYVELEHPEIYLEVLNDGTQSWEFTKKAQEESSSESTAKESSSKAKSPFPVKRLILNKGKVHYSKGQENTIFEDINIDLALRDLKGPVDFTTSFFVQGQEITIKGNAKEIGEVIPLTSELNAFGEKMNIKGDIDTKKMSFNGAIDLQGNVATTMQSFKKVELPKILKNDFKMAAQLYADKDSATINHIDINLGDLKASGEGSYNISKAAGGITLHLTSIQTDIALETKKGSTSQYETKIRLHAPKIVPLFELLEVDTKKLPEFTDQEFFFATAGDFNENEMIFKEIVFSSGQANLSGMIGIKNTDKKSIYSYDFRSDNGAMVAAFFNKKLPVNLGKVRVKGITTKAGDNIDIATNVLTANAVAAIEGSINHQSEIKAPLMISAAGDNLAQTLQQLTGSSAPKGLGKFSLSSTVQGNLAKNIKVKINKSNVAIGSETASINGDSTIALGHDLPSVNLNLELSTLNLDSLSGKTSSSTSDGTSSGPSVGAVSTSQQGSRWSQDKMNLSALQEFEGDINLTIAKLIKGSLVFNEMSAKMHVAKGVLDLSSLTGEMFGGNVTGNGSISSHAAQPMNFKGSIKNAQLKNIIPHRGEIKVTQGTFNSTVDLKSQGNSQYQYMQNLSGDIKFNGNDGKLSGVDLQKAIDSLTQVKNLDGILKTMDASFSGGETNFKNLEGAFLVNKGNAQLTAFKLEAQGATATATGYVDLLNYTMDISATVTADAKGFPPFMARIYGPLDNPSHKLDTGALQQYLMKNVLTTVIDTIKDGKGKPSSILKGIIGIGGKNNKTPEQNPGTTTTPAPSGTTDNTSTNTSPQPAKPVDDLIEKGLNKLLKK